MNSKNVGHKKLSTGGHFCPVYVKDKGKKCKKLKSFCGRMPAPVFFQAEKYLWRYTFKEKCFKCLIFSFGFQNNGKIRTPSRQLFAPDIFEFHKQRPIRPSERSFSCFLCQSKSSLLPLFVTKLKNDIKQSTLYLCPL